MSKFIFSGKFGGLSIALCCHHRCLWKPYVGKAFFEKVGLSERDFRILCKLSGWTAATWSGWKTVQEMNTLLGVKQDEGENLESEQKMNTITQNDAVESQRKEKSTDSCEVKAEIAKSTGSHKENEDCENEHSEQNPLKR